MNKNLVQYLTNKHITDQRIKDSFFNPLYMGEGMKTPMTKKYTQAMAVSYSIKDRVHWPAKVSGVQFLCSVLKQMIREGQPGAFKKGGV